MLTATLRRMATTAPTDDGRRPTYRRDEAITYYQRARRLVDRLQAALSANVQRDFGDYCRMHNCLVNWEYGQIETGYRDAFGTWIPTPTEHKRLAELSKRYAHEQEVIWRISRRFSDHFARYF